MPVEQVQVYSEEILRLIRRGSETTFDAALEQEIDAIFVGALASISAGTPFTFQEQYDGQLVQDVRPARHHESEPSSRGRVPLDLHTDDAFLGAATRAEHLALLGIRNPAEISTVVVALEDVLDRLDPETIDVLSGPSFRFGCPATFETVGREQLSTPARPILHEESGRPREVAFASRVDLAIPGDSDVEHHLRLFRSVLEHVPRSRVALGPGEILVLSNVRCLHGRPAVPTDRWIKRVYLRQDFATLDRVAATRSSRVYSATRAVAYARRCNPAW